MKSKGKVRRIHWWPLPATHSQSKAGAPPQWGSRSAPLPRGTRHTDAGGGGAGSPEQTLSSPPTAPPAAASAFPT